MYAPTLEQAPVPPDMSEAQLFARLSDTTTMGHLAMGPVVAGYIMTHDQPTWTETALQFTNGIMDKDGWLKRRAVRLGIAVLYPDLAEQDVEEVRKKGPTKEMWAELNKYGIVDRPELDSGVDKANFYIVMWAHIVRARRNGHKLTERALEANVAYSMKRDTGMHFTRKEAAVLGVKTNATRINQNKTVGHSLGMGVLSSPVARSPLGRAIGVGIISASTGLGKIGFDRYRRDVRKEKAVRARREQMTLVR